MNATGTSKRTPAGRITDLLAEQGVRPEEVFINLVEVAKENWSFGQGQAQYADAPPAPLAMAAAR